MEETKAIRKNHRRLHLFMGKIKHHESIGYVYLAVHLRKYTPGSQGNNSARHTGEWPKPFHRLHLNKRSDGFAKALQGPGWRLL